MATLGFVVKVKILIGKFVLKMQFNFKEIIEFLHAKGKFRMDKVTKEATEEFIKEKFSCNLTDLQLNVIEGKFKSFDKSINRVWKQCHGKLDMLYAKKSTLLEEMIQLPVQIPEASRKRKGRPEKSYGEKNPRAKRMAFSKVLESSENDAELLLNAAARCASISRQTHLNRVIKEVA